MKIHQCPYRAKNNKTCTHKGTKKNRGKKRKCIYNHAHNCDLFLEWVDIALNQEKSKSTPINPPKKHIGDSG